MRERHFQQDLVEGSLKNFQQGDLHVIQPFHTSKYFTEKESRDLCNILRKMIINRLIFSIPLRESDEGAGGSVGAVLGNPQDLSTSQGREVGALQWRIREGVCSCAKGKKSCQEKRVYKALFIKACNPKGSPQSFTRRREKVGICFLQEGANCRRRQISRVRRPFLPVPRPLPRCSRHMGDLELTQRLLGPPPRARRHRQSRCRLRTRQDVQ